MRLRSWKESDLRKKETDSLYLAFEDCTTRVVVYKTGDMIRSYRCFRRTIIEDELWDGEVIRNVREVIEARGTKVSHGYYTGREEVLCYLCGTPCHLTQGQTGLFPEHKRIVRPRMKLNSTDVRR